MKLSSFKASKSVVALIAAMFVCFLTSCHNEEDEGFAIWDFTPLCAEIQIVDADGNNLLVPDAEGSWYGTDMSMGYEDKVYDAIWSTDESRYYMPHFYGLRFINGLYRQPEKRYLSFGEFDRARNQHLEMTFCIHDINTVYNIEIDHEITWKKKQPTMKLKIKVNGKKIDGEVIKIVLPRR